MGKLECRFHPDSSGTCAVISICFSAAFGALVEILSRKVALLQRREVAEDRGSRRINSGGTGWGQKCRERTKCHQLSDRSCTARGLGNTFIMLSSIVLQLDANDWGIRLLSLPLEGRVRPKFVFFKLLQQFLSSPLSGPYARHMARPFICFNYSCILEWHVWIISSVRLQQVFGYIHAVLPRTL